MRVDLRGSAAPGVSALAAGVGVAVTVGVLEFARVTLSDGLGPNEIQRGLLLVCAVYAAIGLVAGSICWAGRRIALAPAAAFAALVVIASAGAESRPILRLAGVALGYVALRIGAVVLDRFAALPRARLASSAALLAIAGVCALAAQALPAYGPRWALGAAVAAAGGAVLVWTPRVRGSALLLAVTALALVWQGSQHVQRLAPSVKPAPNAPSVLLVTIDTLRADRVGAYGYDAARTPNLDALAKQGVLFRNAYAHSRFTGPSHASILTGLLPSTTGFVVNHQPLDAKYATVAERFQEAGFLTAAFPSSYTTTTRSTGLPARFQAVDDDLREHSRFPEATFRCVAVRPLERLIKGASTWPSYRPAADTTSRAIRFLEANARAPMFAWVHYFDPHLPYKPPAELRDPSADLADGDWYQLSAGQKRAIVQDPKRVQGMRELYDAEIAYVDRELGRLVEAARSTAPAGGLLIVVTSDHGEPMGDHGHFWVRDLYDATLHVPLIVAPASLAHAAPRVVEEDVRLVDLAPTLLALAGAPALSGIDGRSLAPLVAGESEAEPREVIAVSEPEPDEFAGRAAAIRRAGWKLIRMAADLDAPGRWSDAREDLFDVATDPAETANLAATRADVVAELAPRLPKGWSAPAAATITPEERERLRELGYLQ